MSAEKTDENGVVITDATTDVDTIYSRYKDNSFELMTNEMESTSFTGIKESIVNATAILKNITWGGVKSTGQFNVEMVKYLFSMDIVNAIKQPFVNLMSSIARNMTTLAGSIGIAFVALLITFKFIGTQKLIQALKVFGMTILIFTGLAICSDATSANSFFDTIFNVDKVVENEFVKINPVLGDNSVPTTTTVKDKNGNDVQQEQSASERFTSTGELIGSRIFYTNVYEPYLLMNYGTTNAEKIREKQVEYESGEYDRINILLDNDVNTEENEKLHTAVTEYEADELNNRAIQYYNNLPNFFYGLFYLLVNIIQMLVYFVLCFLRLVIAVIQVFLLPVFPILLFTGLFMTESNVFANYFKGFGFTVLIKGMIGFLCILFATFLSLGFQLSSAVDNPWQKILTILIYLLTPLGIWFFRSFLWGMLTGKVRLADAANFAIRPFTTEGLMRKASKERRKDNKERRKQAQEERKAARKKRQEDLKKRGAQDLGLKQKTKNPKEMKQSDLRRELKPKPQHKAPNTAEKAGNKLQNLHEKGREQEAKEQQQSLQRRQRKAYDKENNQTAKELRKANEELGTNKPLNQRRTGQSMKEGNKAPTSRSHRQGQKAPQPTGETNQRKTTAVRSQHRSQGQKVPTTQSVQAVNRRTGGSGTGTSPRRTPVSVRQKQQAVQSVVSKRNQAVPSKSADSTTSAPEQVSRASRHRPRATPKGVTRPHGRK